MTYEEKAINYFKKGYNCAQSVLLAFNDLTGLDDKTALLISSSFGGGMGRLREVCGAVSGMFMVAGLLFGCDKTNDIKLKADHYQLIQNLAFQFKEKNRSIICRELLGLTDKSFSPNPEARTNEYYKKRPCSALVGDAASILDQYLTSINYYQ